MDLMCANIGTTLVQTRGKQTLAQIFQVGEGHTGKIQERKTSVSLKQKRKGSDDVYSVKSSLAVI